jgi:DNA modification methylase
VSSPWKILHGDCLAEMEWMANESVDSIVTDPPYGLNFMNKHWDYEVPGVDVWRECLRVLKPGGHLLSFFGTRTYHRGVVLIEDAGFEIRDQIGWTYGSGFPKSLDVSKAIDKAAGAEREVVGINEDYLRRKPNGMKTAGATAYGYSQSQQETDARITAPATELARKYAGWGTALKPAWEPIVMARKPIVGTVAQNFERYGVGGLNIDGCRVEHTTVDGGSLATNPHLRSHINGGNGGHIISTETDRRVVVPHTQGRFPANLIHDGSDEVLAAFPQAPGQQANASTTAPSEKTDRIYGQMKREGDFAEKRNDSGSAARFFKQCEMDDIWRDLNLPQENASTADQTSFQQRTAAVSALVLAVNSVLPEGSRCLNLYLEPSTNATAIELKKIAESVTQAIRTIDARFWRELKPARLSLSLGHADVVVARELTGIMKITTSRWKLNGSVESVTFNITRPNSEHGAKGYESQPANRFIYAAKANKKDREEGCDELDAIHRVNGNKWTDQDYRVSSGERPPSAESGPRRNTHPTVKPTDLMRYLCRLVTPPNGLVLDPFMGSGSTGKAALLEGFRFVGIEREAEYINIARARLVRAEQEGEL